MSDCKRASLSQIINLFIPAKYVELGDKADIIMKNKTVSFDTVNVFIHSNIVTL